MKLLHLIATPRGNNSRTLAISQQFLDSLKEAHPDIEIEELDLFNTELPPISGNNVIAKYAVIEGNDLETAAQGEWGDIERITRRFLSFDIYLISTPMWNFGVPYPLKHYIDTIMQAGYLFQFTEKGTKGILQDKKLICITSRGGNYSAGSKISSLNYLEQYLTSLFEFVGIEDISFINAQPTDATPELTASRIAEAQEKAKQLAKSLQL